MLTTRLLLDAMMLTSEPVLERRPPRTPLLRLLTLFVLIQLIAPSMGQICTVVKDCNSRASTVTFSNGKCVCGPCRNQWSGSECQLCPIAFNQAADCGACNTDDMYGGIYPNCINLRCGQSDCNDRAVAVTGNRTAGCTCYCQNQWEGASCNYCPPGLDPQSNCGACLAGYSGYPSCSLSCTNAANCSGHADVVYGTTASNCTCLCLNLWSGAACTNCPQYVSTTTQAQCGACIAGYNGYPSCALACTSSANCSGHASTVTGNTNTGCNCSCQNQWQGSTCSVCPYGIDNSTQGNCGTCINGFSGFPNCAKTCTASDCAGHGTASGNYNTGCSCQCKNFWSTSNCSVCPIGYDATQDCSVCASGFSGFPNCSRACTVVTDCSNHSYSVSGTTYSGCKCQCRNGWSGTDCSTCPANSGGSDCDECVSGYTGVPPNCVKECTLAADCGTGATQVQGTPTGCKCTCRNFWEGTRCSVCPQPYLANQFSDCDTCNTNGNQFPSYEIINATCIAAPPACPCVLKCNNQYNCSGRAQAISGNAATGCTCTCRNQFTGPTCSICPDKYGGSLCNQCGSGYGGTPPDCLKLCTFADCSNRATAVSGVVGSCMCTCANQWTGPTCATCPPRFSSTSSFCATCAAGYDTYPQCYLSCTVASNCTNHALRVVGNVNSGCNCTCRNQWNGVQCTLCPALFNASQDCGACINGYGGYPNCQPFCNNTEDCHGNAEVVLGFKGACTCNCRNQWSDATCSTCPAVYNASQDCGTCVTGRDTYPQCFLTCTVASNCSNHATNVTGNTNKGCNCTCRSQWATDDCSYCPLRYDASSDCAACNPNGFGGSYPTCNRVCDAVLDCNGNAVNASGVTPNCSCTCRNQWSGLTCAACPVAYNSANDCGTCAPDYVGPYPQCYLGCNVVANCNSRAVSVAGDTFHGCNCTCRNQWNGSTCATCPPLYNVSQDCGVCINGYVNYPVCSRLCTNTLDCNGHALSVSGIAGNCTCRCNNQWSSGDCSVCPGNFDAVNTSCASCAAGYDTYPQCYLTCTTVANCSNHATMVSGNTHTGCTCSCRNQWNGSACAYCPPNVDAAADCGSCASLYDDYPSCYLTCTTQNNCSGHATAVSGNANTGCQCFCRNQWSTGDCSTCATRYNASIDCGRCAIGYDNYPTCPRVCTNDLDCGGHAQSVSGLYPNCECTCRNSWTQSSNCTVCPTKYNPDYDCYFCNVDYTGVYPNCSALCTIAADCNGNAREVSGSTATGCNCTCRNQWQTVNNGSQCDVCPSNYDAAAGCGACAATFVDYPLCAQLCTVDRDCFGHADIVSGYEPNCSCRCRNQWSGPACNDCATNFSRANDCGTCTGGYEGYPNCYFACTTTANCSGHATGVVGNDAVGCLCQCRNAWTTTNCSVCPPNTDAANDCSSCLPNFFGYPRCRRACTNALDCSGRALAVSGLEGDCVCHCRNAYDAATNCSVCPKAFNASADCASCAQGYEHYPQCYRICTVDEDCSGHASAVSGNTNTSCTCDCEAQWYGKNCSSCAPRFDQSTCAACAPGYEDYPSCYLSCTVEANCSGRAASVSGNANTGCTCVCLEQWSSSTQCAQCPPLFNASAGCSTCTAGYEDYPACYRSCTLDNCTAGTTTRVSGNAHTGCQCFCKNAYSDPTCNTCGVNFTGTTCNACAAGYEDYPNCYRTCTMQQDCNGRAARVSGNDATGCTCVCRNEWSGPQCQTCLGKYDASNDCSSCASGYETYPNCYRTCTAAANCSAQGTASGNAFSGCSCSCIGGWSGKTCDVCPPNFNVSLGCMTCAAGYQDYPRCYPSCTAADCNNHGVATGDRTTGCSCHCRNGWFGTYCAYCPTQYDPETDCYACADGYYGKYPYCTNPSNSTPPGNATEGGVVHDCGTYTEHVTGKWTPGSTVTAATSLKEAEVLFNSYLQQVGCGTSCTRGYLVRRVDGASFLFDITVSSDTAASAASIAACFDAMMNNGSYWGGGPTDNNWPDDPDYYSGCRYGLFNWSYCASWCYNLYRQGNYSCCTWWYNRCYHWSCASSTIDCSVNFGGDGYSVGPNGTCAADPVCKKRMSKWVWGSLSPSLSESTTTTTSLTASTSKTTTPSATREIEPPFAAAGLGELLLSGGALWGLLAGVLVALLLCFAVGLTWWKRRRDSTDGKGRGRRYTKTARTLEDLRHRADSKFVFDELLGDVIGGDAEQPRAEEIDEDIDDELQEFEAIHTRGGGGNMLTIPPPPSPRPLPPPPVLQQDARFDDI